MFHGLEKCESVHKSVATLIVEYLEKGKYASVLKSYVAVGVGLVDGDEI